MKCSKCKKPLVSAQGGCLLVCLEHGVMSKGPKADTRGPHGDVSGLTPTQTPSKAQVSPPGRRGGKDEGLAPAVRSKYGNRKTEVDGILFDSKKEAERYKELKMLEAAGEITLLALQVVYPLTANGVIVGRYIADFAYVKNGKSVVEDAKGCKTPVYKLKKRIFEAWFGELTEV